MSTSGERRRDARQGERRQRRAASVPAPAPGTGRAARTRAAGRGAVALLLLSVAVGGPEGVLPRPSTAEASPGGSAGGAAHPLAEGRTEGQAGDRAGGPAHVVAGEWDVSEGDDGPDVVAPARSDATATSDESAPPDEAAGPVGDDPGSDRPGPPSGATGLAGGWTLVWADEFDGTSVDRDRWTVLDTSTYGDGNGELACLMDRPENVRVSSGTLKIVALREPVPVGCEHGTSRAYTSGHLHTRSTASATYGRFEVRATVPLQPGTSTGLWPAFWMRPVDGGAGEIDVMEQVGTSHADADRAGRVSHTLWYDYVGTYPKEVTVSRPGGAPLHDGFHTYAVEWDPGAVRWYVDDVLTAERTAADVPWMTGTFDRPFYLRLNLAVGGRWPGAPTAATIFPATYEVDYVRVYSR